MTTSRITARPGQILGLRPARRHERPGLYPIFAIAGGSEPAGDPAATPPADPPAAAAAAGAATPPADPPADPPPAAAAGEKVEDLPAWAQRIIRDTRQEAGDARAAGKTAAQDAEAALTKSIGKALGLIKDDEPADPGKLTEQLTGTQAENRTLKVQLALVGAATTHGADLPLLTAVLAHEGTIAKLDPTAANFQTQLDAAVKTALEKNPKLKGVQAAHTSGVSHTGGPGESADIDAAIEAATKAGDHATAIRLKRQKAYAGQA